MKSKFLSRDALNGGVIALKTAYLYFAPTDNIWRGGDASLQLPQNREG